jgi:hypothetical protein
MNLERPFWSAAIHRRFGFVSERAAMIRRTPK